MSKEIKVVVVTHDTYNDEPVVGYDLRTIKVAEPNPEEKSDGKELKIEDYERLFAHSFVMDTMRKLMGRTLTIIDASVANKVQNKAVKDLVRQAYSDEMEFSTQFGFDQDVMIPMAEENAPENFASTVTVEQALGVEELPKQ